MAARIAFRKVTPDGLTVETIEFEEYRLLLLTKDMPRSTGRAVQVMGVALREVSSPGKMSYYEYESLPKYLSPARLYDWLRNLGYTTGTFDQYGNFRKVA